MESGQTNFDVREFIWQTMKSLPEESVNEILNFVLFVQSKTLHPEFYEPIFESINTEVDETDLLLEMTDDIISEHEQILDERYVKFIENPETGDSWENVKQRLIDKHGL